MTFEEAENAHNDINQWWALRDSESTAPPDYKELWQHPTTRPGHALVPVCERLLKKCVCWRIFAFMYAN